MYITDSELEGGHPDVALRAYAIKMREAALQWAPVVMAAAPGGWTDARRDEALHIADLVAQAATLAAKPGNLRESDGAGMDPKLASRISQLKEAFAAVPEGGSLLVPSGWIGKSSGHAIMLAFRRTGPESFSLAVCNSGDGLQYHPESSPPESYPKRKNRTAMHFDGLSRATLTDATTCYALLRQQVPGEGHGPAFFYEWVLPLLLGESSKGESSGVIKRALADVEAQAKHGDWDTPQRAGTCYYR